MNFFGGKNRTKKIQPKNPQQKSNQNLGVSRRKATLQGPGLESFPIALCYRYSLWPYAFHVSQGMVLYRV